MGTTERWIDQQIKERHRRLVRRHWWRLGTIGLAILGLGAAAWLVVPNLRVPVWGVIPALCVFFLAGYWDQLAGTYHLVSGRDAEGWTSKELRKVCGRDWHVVDGLVFEGYDVDHVLVGPGGVFAIETKYTDSSLDLAGRRGQEWAKRCAEQAADGALSVRYLLWHQTRQPIRPVVVVWGSEVSGTPCAVGEVEILQRGALVSRPPWQGSVEVLNPDDVRRIVERLVSYRDSSLNDEPRRRPKAA